MMAACRSHQFGTLREVRQASNLLFLFGRSVVSDSVVSSVLLEQPSASSLRSLSIAQPAGSLQAGVSVRQDSVARSLRRYLAICSAERFVGIVFLLVLCTALFSQPDGKLSSCAVSAASVFSFFPRHHARSSPASHIRHWFQQRCRRHGRPASSSPTVISFSSTARPSTFGVTSSSSRRSAEGCRFFARPVPV